MMTGVGWSRFLEYAARARSKPAFDVEEREWKLEVAEKLRSALAASMADMDRLPELLKLLKRPRLPHLIADKQRKWLREWVRSDPESLRRVLTSFCDPSLDPIERLGCFAAEAERSGPGSAGSRSQADHPHLSSMIAIGAVFNFASSPESLPIVRPGVFHECGDLVGMPADLGDGSAVALYRGALGIAARVREELEAAGVPIRDMIDVQSLIEICVHEKGVWAVDPPDNWIERGHRALPQGAVYLAVCALFRNEAQNLREWIEFHRLVGVERFILYNNESTDEYLEVLAPYLDEQLVILHDWPASAPDQREVYDDCLENHRTDARWIAFIDVDEFLFSPTGERLDRLLPSYEESAGVCVEWAMFSVSGHDAQPGGLVIESYLLRDTAQPGLLKSIVDPQRTLRCESAHWFTFEYGLPVDENGWPVTYGRTKATSFERLRINHYASRSMDELREKIARKSGWMHLRRWRERDLHGELDLVYDDAIACWIPPLRASFERSGALR
jgi:hypothetical protein